MNAPHFLLILTAEELDLLDKHFGKVADEAAGWASVTEERNQKILAGKLVALHEKIKKTAVRIIDITPPPPDPNRLS